MRDAPVQFIEQAQRLSVCVSCTGVCRRKFQILDCLARHLCLGPVMCKQTVILGERLRVFLFVPARDVAMQLLALLAQHQAIGHLLGDDVFEPIQFRRLRGFEGREVEIA